MKNKAYKKYDVVQFREPQKTQYQTLPTGKKFMICDDFNENWENIYIQEDGEMRTLGCQVCVPKTNVFKVGEYKPL